MIEFFKRVFAPSTSSATAKERLRLVLMTDHLSLAPDMIEQMKRDLVEVISRYVEVDREKVEVNFEREDKALAMLANIPIVAVNRPKGGGGEPAPKSAAVTPSVASAPNVVSPGAHAATNANLSATAPPRRRRRKKSVAKPATAHG